MFGNTNTAVSNEQDLYDWLLAQRIFADAGTLEDDKIMSLDELLPGWQTPVTDAEFAHALSANHVDLNDAFAEWWNVSGLSETPMTFAEIRGKAEAKM
jgi:hypothetical protein